jgi:anthranilate synthase component 1
VEVISDGKITESVQTDDPLTFVEEFQKRFEVENIEGLPRFFGGLVGYFGYDTVRYVEPRLANNAPEDTLKYPRHYVNGQ